MATEQGAVLMSKSTNGMFYIAIEHENGDGVCEIALTAEQFAHAITGKHVKGQLKTYGGSDKEKQPKGGAQ